MSKQNRNSLRDIEEKLKVAKCGGEMGIREKVREKKYLAFALKGLSSNNKNLEEFRIL